MQKLGNKIQKIGKISETEFTIELFFQDGFHGTISLEKLFNPPKGEAIDILKGQMFSKCFIENGALGWPNGFELCPDSLRIMIEEQTKNKAS